MRISRSQCALLLILTTAVSGCYSGGKWSMPNLAFWKTNPFSSSDPATASTYPPPANGSANGPAKPSALAANNSGATTTAPPYQSPAAGAYPGSAAAPQYAYPPSPTTAAATRTPNYPGTTPSYSPASPAYTASATNSVTNSSLTPQQGLYGSTGYTDSIAGRQQAPFAPTATAPTSPGSSANSYPSTTNNSYPSSSLPGTGYPSSGYSNPVRPPIPPATTQAGAPVDRYNTASADRYGSTPDRGSNADRYGSSNDRYGAGVDRYSPTGSATTGGAATAPAATTSYGTSVDRYNPSGSASSAPASTTSYGAGADRYSPAASAATGGAATTAASTTSYGNAVQTLAPPANYNRSVLPATTQANASDNRYGDTRSADTSSYTPTASSASAVYGSSAPADRYAPAADPGAANRYTPPSTTPDSSSPAGGGFGSSPGFSPAGSATLPSGPASPYAPPSTSQPAGTSNDAGGYRPGSVTSYTPARSGATANPIATTPDAASPYGVTPANYER